MESTPRREYINSTKRNKQRNDVFQRSPYNHQDENKSINEIVAQNNSCDNENRDHTYGLDKLDNTCRQPGHKGIELNTRLTRL